MSSRHTVELRIEATNAAAPGFQQAAQGLKDLGNAAEQATQQVGTIAGATDKAKTGVSGLLTEAARGASIWAGWQAADAVMSGVSAAVGFVGDSMIGLNDRLQQAEIGFTTMLGSAEAAKAFLDELATFAAQTPFEFPELVAASQKMLAMGFAAEEVTPLLTAIGDAVAAVGGNSEMIDRVTTALGQMESKTKVSAEEMLQLTEAGIPAWQLLADHIGVSVAEVQKMASEGEIAADTFITAFQEFSNQNFGGMMEAQSKTFSGAMSTIRDSLSMAIAEGGEPFFAMLQDGAVQMAQFTSGAEFQDWSQRTADQFQNVADAIRGFVSENKDELGEIGGSLLEVAGSVGTVALELGKIADEAGVFDLVFGGVGDTAIIVGNLAGMIADVAVEVSNIVTDLDEYNQKTEEGKHSTSDMISVTGLAATTWGGLKDLVHDTTGVLDVGFETVRVLTGGMSDMDQAVLAVWERMEAARVAVQGYTTDLDELRAMSQEVSMSEEAQAAAAEAAAEKREAARDAALELNLANMELINSQNLAIDSAAELAAQWDIERLNALTLQDAALGLASAYQEALDVQRAFTSQGSEYASSQKAIEDAVAAVQQKQQEGIPLTEKEILLLEDHEEALGRLEGGQRDATVEAGLAALAAADLMTAQDELNQAIEDGVEDLTPYREAVDEAKEKLGLMGDTTGETEDAQTALKDAIQGPLIGAIEDLTRKVEYIAKPWLVEIDAATEAAAEEVQRLKDMIAAGAVLPVSIVTGGVGGGGSHHNAYASGTAPGGVPQDQLAWVGEKGPELAWLPKGTHILPNDESQRFMSLMDGMPGYASGTPGATMTLGGGAGMGGVSGFDIAGKEAGRDFGEGFAGEFELEWNDMWERAVRAVESKFVGSDAGLIGIMTGQTQAELEAEKKAMEVWLASLLEMGFSVDSPEYQEAYARYLEILKEIEIAAGVAGSDAAQEFWREWAIDNLPKEFIGPAIVEVGEYIGGHNVWEAAAQEAGRTFTEIFAGEIEDGVIDLTPTLPWQSTGETAGFDFGTGFVDGFDRATDRELVPPGSEDQPDAPTPDPPPDTDTGDSDSGGGGGVPSSGDGGGGPVHVGPHPGAYTSKAEALWDSLGENYSGSLIDDNTYRWTYDQHGKFVDFALASAINAGATKVPGGLISPKEGFDLHLAGDYVQYEPFNEGGYITGNGLAMLHANEYITPDQSIPQLAREIVREIRGTGGKQPIQITIPVNLTSPIDGRVLEQRIIDVMTLEERRTI